MKKILNIQIEKFLDRYARYYWYFLWVGIIFLLVFEIYELIHKKESFADPFHLFEFITYMCLLLAVGVLINFLLEANDAKKRTLEILNFKHQISLELTQPEDWNMLITKLVKIPGAIAAVDVSRLFVRDLISGQVDLITTWQADNNPVSEFRGNCHECLIEHPESVFVFNPCLYKTETPLDFCFPIIYANQLLAVIQFKLRNGEELSQEQKDIFENIMPEMAWAFKLFQEQKSHFELQQAEIALAERHSISAYLHDSLNQDLAYLCLKLDQLSANNELISIAQVQAELELIKETANQSYDVVRDMLESVYTQTKPRLINLLNEYAGKISKRANLQISVKEEGQPQSLQIDRQRVVFYLFQEALSNIEKHGGADQVFVQIKWCQDRLSVSISDNGTGFDPQAVDHQKHFGLDIMQERIAEINGKLDIISSINVGTTVIFGVPFRST